MEKHTYLAVAIGGGSGTMLRYFTGTLFSSFSTFPLGTLVANLLGCFLFTYLLFRYFKRSKNGQIEKALLTGFIGSYTTFSTFSLDFVLLFEKQAVSSIIYLIITVLGGVLMTISGIRLGRRQ